MCRGVMGDPRSRVKVNRDLKLLSLWLSSLSVEELVIAQWTSLTAVDEGSGMTVGVGM